MKENRYDKHILRSDEEYVEQYIEDFNAANLLFTDLGASVSIFGSARFKSDNIYCQRAQELAFMLSKSGFHVISGGSGGIMEAANKGAKLANSGESIGINVVLPFEQKTNGFTTREAVLHGFGVRKHMLIKNSISCVIFPGGFGTLDELFEVLVLVQTKKMLPISISLYGKSFWQPLVDFFKTSLIENSVISKEDLNFLHLSDDLEEIVNKSKNHVKVYLEAMQEVGLGKSARFRLMQEQYNSLLTEDKER